MGLAESRTNVNEEVYLKEIESQKGEEEIEEEIEKEEKERRVIDGCNCNMWDVVGFDKVLTVYCSRGSDFINI